MAVFTILILSIREHGILEEPLQGELQSTVQGNKRGHKQMEKHPMLINRKNQYH